MIDLLQVKIWEDYVRVGGYLILSVCIGMKDYNSYIWEVLLQEFIWDLIGVWVEYYDYFLVKYFGQVSMDGEIYFWYIWGDVLILMEGMMVLVCYDSEYYKGVLVVVFCDLDEGSVIYIGVWLDNWELEYELLCKVYGKVGVKIFNLFFYVFIEWWDGVYIVVNYSLNVVEVLVLDGVKVLLGGWQLELGGVMVWVEQ